jgi:hypothetical protein
MLLKYLGVGVGVGVGVEVMVREGHDSEKH